MNETIHIGKANDLEFNWEEELRRCSEYDDKICTCLAMLDCIAGSPNPGNTSGLLKSPQVPLPKFYGHDDENLSKFVREFEQAIQKFNLSNYDKLLLLKQQLEGRALAVVESLESTNQTFTDAKNLLEKAFLDKDSQN